MDIMMPVMDGYETIRAIRAIAKFASLPIIAVTGKGTAGERQRCIDAGANDYVPKPVDSAELLGALRPWLPARSAPPARAIPRPAPDAAHIAPASAFEPVESLDGLKILVVDDDFRNIFAMTALLERAHADVTVVDSGAEAIATLMQMPEFDIVLMDIMMPVMDGYDTIRAIRELDQFKSLTIIAVTGKATAGERQRCLDAGATDYVPKPVDSAELYAAVRPWLPVRVESISETNGGRAPGLLEALAPPPSVAEDAGFGLDGLRILVVDDDFRNIFAMTALLKRAQAEVTVVESGMDAISTLEGGQAIDIVLMDIMMPVMDGYETIRAIRAMGQFGSLPIIAVTGKVTAGERQRCIDAGATDYVPKPVDSVELFAAVRPWLPTTGRPAA
jgi:CheY-like chemotaxis protein